MEQSSDTIIDLSGNALSGIAVRVFAEDGSLAQLYSDNGLTPILNPVYTDPNGRYAFYAANGRYTTRIEPPNGEEYPGKDVLLFDPADSLLVSASDFPTLQAALDSGKIVRGAPGEVYPLTGQINIPSNGGFSDIEFGISSEVFTATSKGTGPENIAIQALNVSNVTLHNVKIVATMGVNSHIYAIGLRGVQGARLSGLDVSGLNAGACVLVDSSFDVFIDQPNLHDCTLDRNIPGGQLTGIVTDDFRIDSVGTERLHITDANITRLLWTPAFLAAYGPQTDGINIQAGTRNYTIANAIIDEVGEGIDTFGEDGVIIAPRVDRALGYGVKFIHGASRNTLLSPRISRSGLGGIVVAGSESVTQNTDRNTILNPVISGAGYDPTGYWSQPTYGIGINNDGVTYKATNTLVRGARILLSADADGAFQSATSGVNNVYDLCESDGTAAAEYLGAGAIALSRNRIGDSVGLARIVGVAPILRAEETDGPTNEKLWDTAYVGGSMFRRTRTDADGAGRSFETVDRTGTTVDQIAWDASLMKFGGVDVATRFATVNGSGLYSHRYDANGVVAFHTYQNFSLTGIGQGFAQVVQLGSNGTSGVTAYRQRVISSDTWTATASTQSAKWALELINAGAFGPAMEYDPAAGLKVGAASAVVAFPNGITRLQPFTVATLPNAASYQWGVIAVTDGAANKRMAISDGTNWRWPDGAIVS